MAEAAATDDQRGAQSYELAEVLYSLFSQLHRQIPREISPTAGATMARLNDVGPQRITVLAEQQGVAQPSMTALVSGLEQSGSVVRRRDPADGRAILVELTEQGRDEVAARRRSRAAWFSGYISELSAVDRERLTAAVPALQSLDQLMRGAGS
ncbi:MarR family winged helix-turn-helix transcriptional regulator [Gordonia sp. VNK21]|uniref:MarR family winged helix-turn-helix transcriptional regulator n=1 Tax=Gordonia sp. VNK21 TaxID=3382483 RepID=UPI0038D4D78F